MIEENEHEEGDKELRVTLKLEFFQKLDVISNYYGILSRTEIIRFLINKEVRHIEKEQVK